MISYLTRLTLGSVLCPLCVLFDPRIVHGFGEQVGTSSGSEVFLRGMYKTHLCCYEALLKSTSALIRMCKMLLELTDQRHVRVCDEFETSSRGEAAESDKHI